MTDRLIRVTTAAAVAAVATVAAVISYRHACEIAGAHGETGVTARLVPFTVDGQTSTTIRNHRPVGVPAGACACPGPGSGC